VHWSKILCARAHVYACTRTCMCVCARACVCVSVSVCVWGCISRVYISILGNLVTKVFEGGDLLKRLRGRVLRRFCREARVKIRCVICGNSWRAGEFAWRGGEFAGGEFA